MKETTLADVAEESREGIERVETLFGVSHDTACLLWMLMSINNLLVTQTDLMTEALDDVRGGDDLPPGDEWKRG